MQSDEERRYSIDLRISSATRNSHEQYWPVIDNMSNPDEYPPFGGENGHFETRFSETESVSEVIIRALSAIEGVQPTALEPLYEVVDPEALDELFRDHHKKQACRFLRVTFSIATYQVMVTSEGHIAISSNDRVE